MTPHRLLVSVFIVWHLSAITIASLSDGAQRPPWHRGVQFLDRAANLYVGVIGLPQRWSMFAVPPSDDTYVRTRYYVQPAAGRRWAAVELVLPAHREDEVRTWRSFRDSYRDKAFDVMLGDFYRRRPESAVRPDTRPEELPDDLAPIARFFARRFAARALAAADRIVRTEVWVASVPNLAPGEGVDASVVNARLVALQRYVDGPVEERLNVRPYAPYHGAEREADLEWVLEYFEEPGSGTGP